MRVAALSAALLIAAPMPRGPAAPLHAQGLGLQVGRLFEGEGWTTYRLGLERPLLGPLGAAVYGTYLRDASPLGRRLWGAGADLSLLRTRTSGPYLVGGVAGGFSSDASDDWWHSWSAGGGYQLVLLGGLALAGEARWRSVAPGRRDGVEVTARIGALFGSGDRRRPAPPAATPAAASPVATGTEPAESRTLPPLATIAPTGRVADAVVATALDALGTGYRLGGTGAEGFDCSGLIQYAYGKHGIALPRTSGDQARTGREVARHFDTLLPGDILTFSTAAGRVTHVGLYLGDGRFVHSASRGVRVDVLSADDPYGKWWWMRWLGARRIVDQ